MPFRTTTFAPGEHYHLCVRGNNKQSIFRSDADRTRLLFLITHFQSPEHLRNIGRTITEFLKENENLSGLVIRIRATRYVTLEAFAFMTNHIHLAIREDEKCGIVRYMQRVLNAYAKYFNTKYRSVGHLFQNPYRAVHIENNDQLLYLSTYIHRNPRELPGVRNKEHRYPWSSYRDYLGENRFDGLLDPSLVLEQFTSPAEYRDFVDSSSAKDDRYLFDPF